MYKCQPYYLTAKTCGYERMEINCPLVSDDDCGEANILTKETTNIRNNI